MPTKRMNLDNTRIYQLQMFRNARTDEMEEDQKARGAEPPPTEVISSAGEEYADFFLFDYYDCLRFLTMKKSRALVYRDIVVGPDAHSPLGLYDKSVHATLTASMTTLVEVGKKHANPFQYDPAPSTPSYSDKPFLALITLTIRSDFFSKNHERYLETFYGVDGFLRQLLNEVEREARDCVPEERGAPIRAYLAVNTGDLVLAVRLSRASNAYKIAFHFRDDALFSNEATMLNGLTFNTFTAISTEMRVEGHSYLPWNDPTVLRKNEGTVVVLRLRVDKQTMQALRTESMGIESMTRPYGLFGHYDVTVRMDFGDFMKIYRYLCDYKFAPIASDEKRTCICKEIQNIGLKKHLQIIACGLVNRRIQLSNERLCVWPDPEAKRAKLAALKLSRQTFKTMAHSWRAKRLKRAKSKPSGCCPSEEISRWREDVHKMETKIDALRMEAYLLPFGRRLYLENIRLLRAVLNAYSAVGDQTESACSGQDFKEVMLVLLTSVERYLNHIKELKREVSTRRDLSALLQFDYEELLKQLSRSVENISNHFRLIYMNNLQTIQVPQYEIDSRVDSRKFILAYMEFTYLIVRNHKTYMENLPGTSGGSRSYTALLPVMSIDHIGDLRAHGLFRGLNNAWRRPYFNDFANDKLLVSISAPSFESFARTFDVLPALMHEVAHFRRILYQKGRNEFFIDLILRKMSEYIATAFIAQANKHKVQVPVYDVNLLVADSVYKAICDVCDSRQWMDMNFHDLFEALQDFFRQSLFYQDDRTANGDLVQCTREAVSFVAGFPTVPNEFNFYALKDAPEDTCTRSATRILKALDREDSIPLDDDTRKEIILTCETVIKAYSNADGSRPGLLLSHLNSIVRFLTEDKAKKKEPRKTLTLEQVYVLLYVTSDAAAGALPWFGAIEEAVKKSGRAISDRRSVTINLNGREHAEGGLFFPEEAGQMTTLDVLQASAFQGILHQLADNLKNLDLAKIVPAKQNGHPAESGSGGNGALPRYNLEHLKSRIREALKTLPIDKAECTGAIRCAGEIEKLLFGKPHDPQESLMGLILHIDRENISFERPWLAIGKGINDAIQRLIDILCRCGTRGNVAKIREIELGIRALKDEADQALQLAMDLHCQAIALTKVVAAEGGTVDLFRSWHREQIGWGTRERIRAELMERDGVEKWLIFSSRYATEITNPLSVMTKDSRHYRELFHESLLMFGWESASRRLMLWKEYYSEAGSDIFMNACLGFSAFAYFRCFEKRYFHSEPNDRKADEARINREQLVLAVQLARENGMHCCPAIFQHGGVPARIMGKNKPNCGKCNARKCYIDASPLQDELTRFAKAQISFILNESRTIMDEHGVVSSKTDKYITELQSYFKGQEEDLQETASFAPFGEARWDAFSLLVPDDAKLRHKLRGMVSRWDLVQYMRSTFYERHLTVSDQIDGTERRYLLVDRLDFEHFKNFMDEHLRTASKGFDETREAEPSCQAVAEWFKNDSIKESDMLKETLIFVLRYYYKHQFRIHGEACQAACGNPPKEALRDE